MKILAHSKDNRGNELITYQFELPTYLLPEILKSKKMEITWKYLKASNGFIESVDSLITLTAPKSALMEFFEKACPKYYYEGNGRTYFNQKELKPILKIDLGDGPSLQNKNHIFWENINQNKTTDIHLQQVAEQMYDLYNESEAVVTAIGDSHIPFLSTCVNSILPIGLLNIENVTKISTALISNPNETDYSKLIEIHNQLVKDDELDTFVHCARVMSNDEYVKYLSVVPSYDSQGFYEERGICDNYKGFINYKHIIENDKKTNFQLSKNI